MKKIVNLGITFLISISLLLIVFVSLFFFCFNKKYVVNKMDSYNYYDAVIERFQNNIGEKVIDGKVLDIVLNLFDRNMVKDDINLILDNYIYGYNNKINHDYYIKDKLNIKNKDTLNNYIKLINNEYRGSFSIGTEYEFFRYSLSLNSYLLIIFTDILLFMFLLFVSYKLNNNIYNLYVSLFGTLLLILFMFLLMFIFINYNFLIRSHHYTLFIKYLLKNILFYNVLFICLYVLLFIIFKRIIKL